MEYIEFIHQIKEKSDEDYLIWYIKTIKNSKTLNDTESNIFPKFDKPILDILLSIHERNNEYYEIFSKVLKHNIEEGIIYDSEIMKIFAPESDHFYYYIECCRNEFIKKISEYYKS